MMIKLYYFAGEKNKTKQTNKQTNKTGCLHIFQPNAADSGASQFQGDWRARSNFQPLNLNSANKQKFRHCTLCTNLFTD